MELELKMKDQTDIDYNGFFYATMCHVCKRFGDDVPLKRCSSCKLISYCSPQHQKQHWAQHKTLCKVVRDVLKDELKDGSEMFDITLDKWDYWKVALMQMVAEKKGSLELYENQMFLFPKECAVCNEQNVESLIDCQNCAVSFCKAHDIVHKDACAPLKLCLRINLAHMKKLPSIEEIFLEHSSNMEICNTFQDMNDFIKNYGNIEEVQEMSYDVLAAGLSEHLTCPLTLLRAMRILNYVPKRKELVIHVLAASDVEEYTLKMWEILLHLIPKTKVSLMIVIIRSELNNESHFLSVCDNCLSRGQKISFKFHNGLYENYVRSSSFVKPDFAVAFNVDIQAIDTCAEITMLSITMLSIKMLSKQNCPFLITNHTQETLEKSVNRINTTLNSKVDLVFSGKNPFASLRPHRRIRGRELVFYFNNFVAIYRSLCS